MNSKDLSAKDILLTLRRRKSKDWQALQISQTLRLFRKASIRVPAYKDFLKKNRIKVDLVKTWEDFQSVPMITKDNYLRHYPLPALCWDGTLSHPFVFTSTSGSTGDPVFFLRQQMLDWQYSVLIEEFLRNSPQAGKGPVLVVVCFGMGVWIGGIITYKAFEIAAERNNFPLSIITPGINKKEIFNALEKLSPHYSQTILIGYPPLVKDIIDEAIQRKIPLSTYHMRFLFAAEAISETYRDYIAKAVKIANIYTDTLNIYGSADIGAMAEENGIAILLKRIAKSDKKLFSEVFSPIQKTPTLAQYNPLFINFEAVNGSIALSGDSAMPLVRYAIGDNGGVFRFDEAEEKLAKFGYSLKDEAKAKLLTYSQLPFVYVYERADLSATFYGLWIYPEWLRESLLEPPADTFLTGKFTLITTYDRRQNQRLDIHLEQKKGVSLSKRQEKLILKSIVDSLCDHSSEYRELTDKLRKQAWPKLFFWEFEDARHFQPGIKQKWVKKI